MIKLVERIIHLKNPLFQFDKQMNFGLLLGLIFDKAVYKIRVFKLLWRGRWEPLLFLGKDVKFINLNNIHFGKFVQIGNHVTISALGTDKLVIGNNSKIGDFSKVEIATSFNNFGKGISIGNNVGLGEFAYLGGAGGLSIGDGCIVGQYLSCHPENHNYTNLDIEIRLQGVTRLGIEIGPNCWIGSKVTILDGVSIGGGSIIAAGAVVTKSFPENSIIGGVPARLLKNRFESTDTNGQTQTQNLTAWKERQQY